MHNFKVPSSVVEIGSYAMQFRYVDGGYIAYNVDKRDCSYKVYGAANSVAEQYAKSNGLNFVIVTN